MDFPYVVRQNLVIIDATSPNWGNAEHTVINMMLTVADAQRGSVEIGFSAVADDTEEHGRLLFAYAQTLLEPIAEFVPKGASAYELQVELDKIMADIPLGLASQADLELARHLRIQIKTMTELPADDPAVHFNTVKQATFIKNNQAYEAATISITANYPQMEKDTWPTQDREVKAWVLDPENAETPWIDTAAAIRGVDRTLYLQRTLAKTQQFEQVSAYLTGLRQKYEDQIKVAVTLADLEAVKCVYNIPSP